jgi:hypothetical protein
LGTNEHILENTSFQIEEKMGEDTENEQIKQDSLSDKRREDKNATTSKISSTHELETTREGSVRTWKENGKAQGTHFLESTEQRTSEGTERRERARGTHRLESAEQGTHEDTERKGVSLGHSPTGEHRVAEK